jgi:deoxyribose-phosphate aldolase
MTTAASAAPTLSAFERQRAEIHRAVAAIERPVPQVLSPALARLAAMGAGTLADARVMVEAGATQLGTSAGVNIAQQAVDEAAAPGAAPTGY